MTYQPILKTLTALALVGFLAACESSEERAEKHYQSGLALMEQGETERALVELRNVFDLNGSHIEARQLYAKTMRDLGRFGDAYGQYLRLAEQAPDDPEARIALSEMAYVSNNWDQFETHSARALRLAPEDVRVKAVSAAAAYRQAVLINDGPARDAALSDIKARLADMPKNRMLLRIALDGAIRGENYEEALGAVDAALTLDPDDRLLHTQRTAILARLQDAPGLEAQLKDMVQRYPDDTDAKQRLLNFYMGTGAPEKAEAFMREASDPSLEEPGMYLSLVQFIAAQKGIDAAVAELDSVIGTLEDDSRYRALRAGFIFDRGDREEGITAMQDLLEGSTPSVMQRRNKVALARMLLLTGNEVGARQLVEQVLAEDDTQVEALKMNATWQIQGDDFNAAISSLRTALDEAPQDVDAMTLMSRAYQRSGNASLARDFLSLAVDASGRAPEETLRYARFLAAEERVIPAEQTLIASLEVNPGNPALLSELGSIYITLDDMGRLRQVISELKAIGTEPASRAATGLEAALIERTSGTEEAIAFLESITKDWDNDSSAKVAIIRSRLMSGNREAALASAQELLDEDPENPGRKYLMAATQAAAGQLDEAKASYEALLQENPKIPAIWLQLIRIATIQNDEARVATLLEQALQANPGAPQLLFVQAGLLERAGDFEGAIEVYETLYAQSSSSVVIANNLASLLTTHRGDEASFERAAAVAARLRGIPEPAFQDTWGWIALNRGDVDEALAHLEPAATGIPNDAVVQYHLGRAYEAAERPAEARAQYERALELAEANGDTRPQVEDARTRLEALPAE